MWLEGWAGCTTPTLQAVLSTVRSQTQGRLPWRDGDVFKAVSVCTRAHGEGAREERAAVSLDQSVKEHTGGAPGRQGGPIRG